MRWVPVCRNLAVPKGLWEGGRGPLTKAARARLTETRPRAVDRRDMDKNRRLKIQARGRARCFRRKRPCRNRKKAARGLSTGHFAERPQRPDFFSKGRRGKIAGRTITKTRGQGQPYSIRHHSATPNGPLVGPSVLTRLLCDKGPPDRRKPVRQDISGPVSLASKAAICDGFLAR